MPRGRTFLWRSGKNLSEDEGREWQADIYDMEYDEIVEEEGEEEGEAEDMPCCWSWKAERRFLVDDNPYGLDDFEGAEHNVTLVIKVFVREAVLA